MDPKHRDRVAFIRVCSGKFEKDMSVKHSRTGKTIRLSRPQKIFGQDREVVDDAYPGDVIGLNNPGMFSIGDTFILVLIWNMRAYHPLVLKYSAG